MNTILIFHYYYIIIDKNIVKTEIRKKEDISTIVLVKMRKNETVSMDSLARIVTVMGCGIDDIVEINTEHGYEV